ncbi:hypothetical protein LCGC14_1079950 [marine sediment metagenome]|uniref:Uncharacterized protein n=1 Tax=marine sediment metagenome TaxID=412755 RepID=A0A0F9QLE0_9ZZZZ
MSLRELVLDLCGGNPGCLKTLMELGAEKLDRLVKLRDLGYKGPFIWLLRKDLLDMDMDRFKELLDNDELKAEVERAIKENGAFARQWRYHKEHY